MTPTALPASARPLPRVRVQLRYREATGRLEAEAEGLRGRCAELGRQGGELERQLAATQQELAQLQGRRAVAKQVGGGAWCWLRCEFVAACSCTTPGLRRRLHARGAGTVPCLPPPVCYVRSLRAT